MMLVYFVPIAAYWSFYLYLFKTLTVFSRCLSFIRVLCRPDRVKYLRTRAAQGLLAHPNITTQLQLKASMPRPHAVVVSEVGGSALPRPLNPSRRGVSIVTPPLHQSRRSDLKLHSCRGMWEVLQMAFRMNLTDAFMQNTAKASFNS